MATQWVQDYLGYIRPGLKLSFGTFKMLCSIMPDSKISGIFEKNHNIVNFFNQIKIFILSNLPECSEFFPIFSNGTTSIFRSLCSFHRHESNFNIPQLRITTYSYVLKDLSVAR